MALTEQAVGYVVNVVFQVPKEGLLCSKALVKSGDIDFMAKITLHDSDIDSLTYDTSDTVKDTPLTRVDKTNCFFGNCMLHCHSVGSNWTRLVIHFH